MYPEFTRLSDAAGLEVVDPIETRRMTFATGRSVEPTPADPGRFTFPVDSACRIRTDRLSLRYAIPVDVRAPDGTHRESIDPPAASEFPAGEHLLELHGPIKVYVRVAGAVGVGTDADSLHFEFGERTAVEIGARSYHSSPAATVTVPDDPEAMMEAISAFSSSLKTTSPERAWPTLRGHPPRVERGDELIVPKGLESPETGVEIRLPPEYGHVYTVAPLAYYLGAEVVAGETARLTTESGASHHLGDDLSAMADETERLLKRTVLLDCVTRTEGYYPDDLHEREVLESRVDLDFAALYDAPFGERLAAYLAVPDDALDDVLPTWHRVTHVETDPGPEPVELLPYVVNDLSVVRVNAVGDDAWTPSETQRRTGEATGDFVRSVGVRSPELSQSGTEDGGNSARGVPGDGGYTPLPETDALEQAWIGDRTPIQGTKLLPAAFANETPAPTDGVVEITVVCNDEEMREEWETVSEIYADRDDVQVSATCEFGVTTDDLRDLLARESDMFHFIGHIDGRGFQCPDGVLDAEEIDETGATAVLLNGCRSHDQGIALVEAGANAAVVSLADLWNSGAIEVGETLARLFYHGFSIGHAMEIVREYTSLGNQYVVMGDPGMELAQCNNGIPFIYHLTEVSNRAGEWEAEFYTYPLRTHSIGTIVISYAEYIDKYYIASGKCNKRTINKEELEKTIPKWSAPLVLDGELTWGELLLDED
ncbi:CHAT domain-containing protein [Halorussus amylolyticus]|uniref:hypothetical protein n=1 Tax=Halorussus amylolyticus TaxID=1126242 RepID=UPI001045C72D|nr:hypothetical protein [Halorussus amylolyticus]